MTLTELKSKASLLAAEFMTTESRRALWRDRTKEYIFSTLSNIVKETSLPCFVQKNEFYTNHEGVNLQFGSRPSGISRTSRTSTGTTMENLVLSSGYITFSQSYNGKVFVIIVYPYVEGIVGKSEPLVVGQYEHVDINEPFIYSHVCRFLDEMIMWENNTKPMIGFQHTC